MSADCRLFAMAGKDRQIEVWDRTSSALINGQRHNHTFRASKFVDIFGDVLCLKFGGRGDLANVDDTRKPRRCCDGKHTTRNVAGRALSALGGFGLPQFLAARENGLVQPGKAKRVILLYLFGGAATQDMVDLKPLAPKEVRSQFNPISTSASGIEVCEHLPQMAKWMP